MRDHNESNLTDAVLAACAGATDPRTKTIVDSLVRHLHGFVRDVSLTNEEWFAAVQFLAAAGQMCNERRNEFILLSDLLGVSMLVDAISNRLPAEATQTTVLGPFFDDRAPVMPYGGHIGRPEDGAPCVVSGRVLDLTGNPVIGAELNVWQANEEGFYDSADPRQPDINLRGKFQSGADGTYCFVGVKPEAYEVPTDGPGGRLLAATGRKVFRPAHIHLMVSAPGLRTIVTHVFVEGDPHLDADPVFGTKEALIVPFTRVAEAGELVGLGLTGPAYRVAFNVVLAPEAALGAPPADAPNAAASHAAVH